MIFMYVNITGSKNNKDVYIYQSYRKANGKPSSHIYRKLGKYNDLLEQFSGDSDKLMAWAKEEAAKDTAEYNAKKEKVSIDFSQTYRIPLDSCRLPFSAAVMQRITTGQHLPKHPESQEDHLRSSRCSHGPYIRENPFSLQQTEQLCLLPDTSGAAQIFPAQCIPCTFCFSRRIGFYPGRTLP